MEFVFHRGSGPFSKAIQLVTHSDITHVEILFHDDMSFSARSERKPAVDIIKFDGSDGKWERVRFPQYTDERESLVRAWCESKRGEAYNWMNIGEFVIPEFHPDSNKLICSVGCVEAAQQIQLFSAFEAHKVSPSQLYTMALSLL